MNRRSDTDKRLEGRRVNGSAAAIVVDMPPPPEPPPHLTETEKAAWHALTASLPAGGRYDPGLIEAYVTTLTAQRDMIKRGLVTVQQIRAYAQVGQLLRQLGAEIQNAARFVPVRVPITEEQYQAETMEMIIGERTKLSPAAAARLAREVKGKPGLTDAEYARKFGGQASETAGSKAKANGSRRVGKH